MESNKNIFFCKNLSVERFTIREMNDNDDDDDDIAFYVKITPSVCLY
jgi:hypothetical protein